MAPCVKRTASKVITADKVLNSTIFGCDEFIPSELNIASNKDHSSKSSLLNNIENDEMWYNHIKVRFRFWCV